MAWGFQTVCHVVSSVFLDIEQGAIVNRTVLIHMQLAASVFHRLTSKTTMSSIASLVFAWVLHHMETRGGGAREKEHFVFRLRKYTWKRKENLLNKIRRENMHTNKILESYKIITYSNSLHGSFLANFFWPV